MSQIRKVIISVFILFNFLIMLRIHLPLHHQFVSSIYKPIDAYLSFFSLYQSWRMFAPNPSRISSFLIAEVTFDDGTKDVYPYPNPKDMSLIQKYLGGERYRVLTEAIRKDENSFMWEDTAKYALRKLKDDNFYKIPLRVELVRHWTSIPDMIFFFRDHRYNEKTYESYRFFTYEVF